MFGRCRRSARTSAVAPGYIAEVLGLASLAAAFLLVATLGCALRAGDPWGRAMATTVAFTIATYLAWIGALAATAALGRWAPSALIWL